MDGSGVGLVFDDDDDLASLRRRQKEERRRNKRREKEERRKLHHRSISISTSASSSSLLRPSSSSSSSSLKSKRPVSTTTSSAAACSSSAYAAVGTAVPAPEKNDDEDEERRNRRERLDKYREEKKRREGAALLRKLFPETVGGGGGGGGDGNDNKIGWTGNGARHSSSARGSGTVSTKATSLATLDVGLAKAAAVAEEASFSSAVQTAKVSNRTRPAAALSVLDVDVGKGVGVGDGKSEWISPRASTDVETTTTLAAAASASSPQHGKILFGAKFASQRGGDHDSSSSDEDLVAASRRIEARRREEEKKRREEREKRRQQEGGDDDVSNRFDAEDDALLASAKRLEAKRKLAERRKRREETCVDSDDEDLLRAARRLEEKKRRQKLDPGESPLLRKDRMDEEGRRQSSSPAAGGNKGGDGEGEEDLVAAAKRMETKRHEDELRRKERERPRNPLTVAAREEEEMAQWTTSSPSRKKLPASTSPRPRPSASFESDDEGGLWDDSSSSGGSEGGSSDSSYGDEDEKKRSGRKRKKKNGGRKNGDKRKVRGNDSRSGSDQTSKRRSTSADGTRSRRGRKRRSSSSAAGRGDSVDVTDALLEGIDNDDEDDLDLYKPEFSKPRFPPSALDPLVLPRPVDGAANRKVECDEVPASINRYLQHYQRDGIRFMHSIVTRGKGCILGDDMGLGKTVQVIGLLAALLGKTGTGRDLKKLQTRRHHVAQDMMEKRDAADRALLKGSFHSAPDANALVDTPLPSSAPVLIVVPPSLMRNWMNEFNAWGHFAVSVFQDKDREIALERVKVGMEEIMICGKALFSQDASFELINSVQWKLVFVDEFHEMKNNKSRGYECLERLRHKSFCPVIGMTGTLMSNNHKELFHLVDLVQPGLLGEWKAFNKDISRPIMLSRSKEAKHDAIELGKKTQRELDNALKRVLLERKKSVVLKDSLTEKTEKVVFVELSDVQKRIYRHILSLSDYFLVKTANAPCDCGINRTWFLKYQKMRTKAEQIDYSRRHRKELIRRKKCCHSVPLNPKKDEPGQQRIDPDAVLWLQQHESGEQCENCPSCILLPALQKLYKVCSHASLLQVDRNVNNLEEGSEGWKKAQRTLEFAKVALPPDVLNTLPGGYYREDSIMNDHIQLSGKMKALDICLQKFYSKGDRVLLFSYSTSTLDLIQHYVRAHGYSYLRLDGTTQTKKRQGLVDRYQSDNSIFLFLISTKAGGLGLNLTAANKVVVFDVNWNPSYDEQAQDRAFRIGQRRDVDVVRLVARGTVEELMYARQLYKVQLKKQTLGGDSGPQPARMFRGVDQDKNRKGELFGLENLLKFKDGSFIADVWQARFARGGNNGTGNDMQNVSELTSALQTRSEEEINHLGGEEEDGDIEALAEQAMSTNDEEKEGDSVPDIAVGAIRHEDFMREDRGGAALEPGDAGFDEEMGGASQILHVACAMACDDMEGSDAEEKEQEKEEKSSPWKEPLHRPSPPAKHDQIDATPELQRGQIGSSSSEMQNKEPRLCESGERAQGKETRPRAIGNDSNVQASTGTVLSKRSTSGQPRQARKKGASPKVALMGGMPRKGNKKHSSIGLYIPSYAGKKKKKKAA